MEGTVEAQKAIAHREMFLHGALTIQRVAELKKEVSEALYQVDHLTINLAGTSKVDLSGLQLLCASHRSALRLGKSLSLALSSKVSTELTATLQDAGLVRHVGCPAGCRQSCLWMNTEEGS